MKKIVVSGFFFISLAASAQNAIPGDTAVSEVITAEGKPIGKKTVLKLTKDGGRLISSDGMAELIFPLGAVSKKTDISIQPLTNLMPTANGNAYRFGPSGIQFQKPVQLIFHYDEEETTGDMQSLLGIAMQGDKGQWLSLNNSRIDTIAKTVSGSISHFSDWAKFEAVKLYPTYERIKVRTSLDLTIDVVSGEEELSPLESDPMLSALKKRNIPWTASWRATAGTIERQSKTRATYTAPASVPNQNPVAVTATLTGLTYKYKGTTFNNLRLVSNILVFDNAWEVTMISEMQDPGIGTNLGAAVYRDTGSFVVSLNGQNARIIERVNRNTSCALDYSGGCCSGMKIIKPGSGNIHIAGTPVIKVLPGSGDRPTFVEISFGRVPTIFPLFQVTCQCPGDKKPFTTTNSQSLAMGGMITAHPIEVKFEAKEGEQIILKHGEPGDPIYVRFIVRQLNEND